MTKASETRASRHPKGTTDPDGDGKMGGSLSQAEADRRAAPAHNPEDPPEGNGLAAGGATTRDADQPAASGTSSIQTTDEAPPANLAEHFERMQDTVREFLTPDSGITNDHFISKMIEACDGPDQRRVQGDERPTSELARHFDGGYHESAMRAAAGPDVFHPQIGGAAQQLAHDMVTFIRAARAIDGWKSRLFYGKHKVVGAADVDALARQQADYSNVANPQLIHGILGIASEAGEIAEDLLKILVGAGTEIDDNIEREQGDIDWFQELVAEAREVSIPECRFRNIMRLRERFPAAFSEEDAVARADEA